MTSPFPFTVTVYPVPRGEASLCPERKRLGAVHAFDLVLPSLPPCFSIHKVPQRSDRVRFTIHKVPQAQRQGAPLVNTPRDQVLQLDWRVRFTDLALPVSWTL